MSRNPTPLPPLSIAAAERDTGIGKDTLRAWERRYGFPTPRRDATGERLYEPDDIEKLRLLRRLLDAGYRPGRVVKLPLADLQRMVEEVMPPLSRLAAVSPTPVDADLDACIDLLRHHDLPGLRAMLGQARARLGLARFVTEVIAPLNIRVGDAWMRGQLQIFEEHAYTEAAQVALRGAIAALPATDDGHPHVLLTTFPGEPHGLGLLMAEALFTLEGARCVSLGVATPLWDISLAAQAHRCDVVALSFTGCMNPNHVVSGLAELRSKLPASIEIWAGGMAPVLHRRPPAGVHPIGALPRIADEIRRWREAAAGGDRSA